jgi:hypothetical protein
LASPPIVMFTQALKSSTPTTLTGENYRQLREDIGRMRSRLLVAT